jgi:hypothetical protein
MNKACILIKFMADTLKKSCIIDLNKPDPRAGGFLQNLQTVQEPSRCPGDAENGTPYRRNTPFLP